MHPLLWKSRCHIPRGKGRKVLAEHFTGITKELALRFLQEFDWLVKANIGLQMITIIYNNPHRTCWYSHNFTWNLGHCSTGCQRQMRPQWPARSEAFQPAAASECQKCLLQQNMALVMKRIKAPETQSSQHISTYLNISQHISTYLNKPQHISTNLNISQHISTVAAVQLCSKPPAPDAAFRHWNWALRVDEQFPVSAGLPHRSSLDGWPWFKLQDHIVAKLGCCSPSRLWVTHQWDRNYHIFIWRISYDLHTAYFYTSNKPR